MLQSRPGTALAGLLPRRNRQGVKVSRGVITHTPTHPYSNILGERPLDTLTGSLTYISIYICIYIIYIDLQDIPIFSFTINHNHSLSIILTKTSNSTLDKP